MRHNIKANISLIKSVQLEKNIDQQKAEYLIKIGAARAVICRFSHFDINDTDKLIDQIIEHNESSALFRYINKLSGVNQDHLIKKLIKRQEYETIAENCDYFNPQHHNKIAKILLKNKLSDLLTGNLAKFQSLNKSLIKQLMSIDPFNADCLTKNISSFNLTPTEKKYYLNWLNE